MKTDFIIALISIFLAAAIGILGTLTELSMWMRVILISVILISAIVSVVSTIVNARNENEQASKISRLIESSAPSHETWLRVTEHLARVSTRLGYPSMRFSRLGDATTYEFSSGDSQPTTGFLLLKNSELMALSVLETQNLSSTLEKLLNEKSVKNANNWNQVTDYILQLSSNFFLREEFSGIEFDLNSDRQIIYISPIHGKDGPLSRSGDRYSDDGWLITLTKENLNSIVLKNRIEAGAELVNVLRAELLRSAVPTMAPG